MYQNNPQVHIVDANIYIVIQRVPTGLSSISMYSDHFFFLITDLLEYKNLLRICSKPPKTGTQFVRTQQMSKCLIIPDVFNLRYPNNKSSLFLKNKKTKKLCISLDSRGGQFRPGVGV